ncbi:MAG TPA: hypothetical protein VGB94_11100 [Acidobacteriaceae bacterium]
MMPPARAVPLLQKLAQACSGNAVMQLASDHEVGAIFAAVLAEATRQAKGSVGAGALHIVLQDGKILGVSAREARASEANYNLD